MSSTNRGSERAANDFYATPDYAFKPLLPLLYDVPAVWEPACGDGRLVKWMREAGINASGTDLFMDPFGLGHVDFLKDDTFRPFILTNPPFSIAVEFFDHALKHADEVLMLQRLNYLATRERYDWWTKHEPDALFVLSVRPDFDGRGGDSTDYCWYYWGKRFKGVRHLLGEKPKRGKRIDDVL